MKHISLIAALIATASTSGAAFAAPKDYSAAIAHDGRSAAAIKQDEGRKPAEILDFLGLKKGMDALDVLAIGGYYTQIMARAVGSKGSVTAFEPTQFLNDKSKAAWTKLIKVQPNINLLAQSMDKYSAKPASFDFAMLHLVYHDFYWKSAKFKVPEQDPKTFLKSLHDSMRAGGIVGVVDHVGGKGDTRATVQKTHRIDPAVIKADFVAAGFVFEAESNVLRTAADNDLSKSVFVPEVRGKSDRVVYRFRKPK